MNKSLIELLDINRFFEIDRRGIFPDSLACEGKESVGIIVVKSLWRMVKHGK